MNPEHPDLPPFEATLRPIIQIAFDSGTEAIQSKGYKFEDIQSNKTAHRVFVRGSHYGYDKAQQRIGVAVIALEKSIQAEETVVKEIRRNRKGNIKEVIERLRALKERQLILRRVLDTIVYSIIMPDEWIIRRLGDDRIRRIDPKVVERTLQIANSNNQDTRNNFSVVSDLTTAVHIGDIFQVVWPPGESKKWRILELKEGKVNSLLSEFLGDKEAPLNEEERKSLEQKLGRHAVKQAERILRQKDNLTQLEKVIETDRGIDYNTKKEIILTPDVAIVDDYEEELAALIEDAALKGWASTTVDGCLHLVAMTGEMFKDRGHKALIPAFHLFANLHSPSSYCKPQTKEEIRRELHTFSQKAPILDLVNHNMKAPRGRPMFIWMDIPQKRHLDLAIGHIRLFAHFDIEAFLKCVTDSGINVSKISSKEADKIKEFSPAIPGFPNVYGFEVRLPSGNVHMLLNGFFSRAFLYLTKPSSLLMMIKRWDEQDVKMFKTHFGEVSENGIKSN